MSEKKRANYLQVSEFYRLNVACRVINQSFGNYGCYLVGSVLKTDQFRDIDIRCVLADDNYDLLFNGDQHIDDGGDIKERLSLINHTFSLYLSNVTGLKNIDFQFQRWTAASREFSDEERVSVGR